MTPLILARLQFALTSVYHFFFVPLTLGLSVMVAVMETLYVRTGKETYKWMTRFWGKLFLINFAVGVVTGLVQEFQFGMNWSGYSRIVGDIFGAPLAIEALLAFFLESVFLGIWVFGWDKLSKGLHALVIWLVALGSSFSALWILIANSFMQEPVGYRSIPGGGIVMENFFALVKNPHVWYQFPHVLAAGLTTAAFFMMGISAYQLLRKHELEIFKRSFQMAAILGVISSISVVLIGHAQGQFLVKIQPMKSAALEALWETENPAPLSLFAWIDTKDRRNPFAIRIPKLLSFLLYNRFYGEVKGINELEVRYISQYGQGDYIPPVLITFWSFRLMVGSGFIMVGLVFLALLLWWRKKIDRYSTILKIFSLGLILPYLANSSGWILTEVGRYPWVVYGLLKMEEGASPNVTAGMLWVSLIGYILIYGALIIATIYLLRKEVIAGLGSIRGEPLLIDESIPSVVKPQV